MAMKNVNGKWVNVVTFEEKVDNAASFLVNDINNAKRELHISSTPKPIYEAIRIALKPEPKVETSKGFTAAQLAKMGYKSPRTEKLSEEEMEDMLLGANLDGTFVKWEK